MVYVGIDYSINGPAMCIFDKGKYYFYFITTRKKLIGFIEEGKNYYIESFEYPEWKTREERFDKLSSFFVDCIKKHIARACKAHKIMIEGYSFGSEGSSNSSIYENGAIIRHKIHKLGGFNYAEIPPKQLKKYYTGNGNANKFTMYYQFMSEKYLDFCNILGLKIGEKVPNPIQDLVDAYAITEYMRLGTKRVPNSINKIGDMLKETKNVLKKNN